MIIKIIEFPVLLSLCYRKRLGDQGVIGMKSIEFEEILLRKIHKQSRADGMLAVFWVADFLKHQ